MGQEKRGRIRTETGQKTGRKGGDYFPYLTLENRRGFEGSPKGIGRGPEGGGDRLDTNTTNQMETFLFWGEAL